MSVGTLSLCTGSYSLTKTSYYCSPAFYCKIRIYLFPNFSFATWFQDEHSSYESLVRHTRVFYLVVLIEHFVNCHIQTRLSGERPRIHGVRLSVAYSICAHFITPMTLIGLKDKKEPWALFCLYLSNLQSIDKKEPRALFCLYLSNLQSIDTKEPRELFFLYF